MRVFCGFFSGGLIPWDIKRKADGGIEHKAPSSCANDLLWQVTNYIYWSKNVVQPLWLSSKADFWRVDKIGYIWTVRINLDLNMGLD